MEDTIVVTGSPDLIGSAVVRHLLGETPFRLVNADQLTCAGDSAVLSSDRYCFEPGNVCGATRSIPERFSGSPAGRRRRALEWVSGRRPGDTWKSMTRAKIVSGGYRLGRIGLAGAVA